MAQWNQYNTTFAPQIYQEYQITTSGTASSPQLLAFNTLPNVLGSQTNAQQVVIVEARSNNVIFNFGGSSVVASATLTGNALPAGNFSVPAGAIFEVIINGNTQNYVSVIQQGGAGTAIIRLGYFNL